MNAPFPLSASEQAETPAEALDRAIAQLEAWGVHPKPKPTADEIAQAEAKADEAMRSLIAPLLTDAELANISRGHRQFNREHRRNHDLS